MVVKKEKRLSDLLHQGHLKVMGIMDPERGRRAGEAAAKWEMEMLWKYAEKMGFSVEMIDNEKERINALRKRAGRILATDREILRDLILKNSDKKDIETDPFLMKIQHSKDLEDSFFKEGVTWESLGLPKTQNKKKGGIDIPWPVVVYMNKSSRKK